MAIRNDILQSFEELVGRINICEQADCLICPKTKSQIAIVRRALKEYQRELNARIRIERSAPKRP